MYITNYFGSEMYQIYMKNSVMVLKWLNYIRKLLIVNISLNNKFRDLIFECVIAVIMTVMSINFLRNWQVLLKDTT